MKHSTILCASLFFSAGIASGCASTNATDRLVHIHLEEPIEAKPEAVWAVVGQDFANVSSWADLVSESRALTPDEVPSDLQVAATAPVVGRATVARGQHAKEVLTQYSDDKHEFTFVGVDTPKVIVSAQNHTRVRAEGGGSVVSFDIAIEAKNRFVKRILQKRMPDAYAGVLKDLKTHVENSKNTH